MSAIIAVEKLAKQYDPPKGIVAVKGISFDVRQGEILGLLGPNGSGKTTVIGMLSGLLAPTGGDATVDGHSIVKAAHRVKQAIGVVPQEVALYSSLSAYENLDFWGKMYGLGGKQRKQSIAQALEITDLAGRAKDRVAAFSGGMKRRLNIAVGLLHNPKILYMDEPTVGIDPQSRRHILDTVKQLNRQGMTILYTTHYMEEAEELCHRIGVMDHGELIAMGTEAELAQRAGEFGAIHITLGQVESGPEAVTGPLAQLPDVSQVHMEADRVVVQTKHVNRVFPLVVNCLSQANLSVKQLEVQEPNLETLFLHLTGRALRD